jgi:hypothetical protein
MRGIKNTHDLLVPTPGAWDKTRELWNVESSFQTRSKIPKRLRPGPLLSLGDLGLLGGSMFSIPTHADELCDLCVLRGESSLGVLGLLCGSNCLLSLQKTARTTRKSSQKRPLSPAISAFPTPCPLLPAPCSPPQPTLHNGKFPRRRFRSTFVFAK